MVFDESEDEPFDAGFLSGLEGTLPEWDSENDDEAYCDL